MIAILALAGVAGLLLLSVALAALNVSKARQRARKTFRKTIIRHAPDNLHYRPFISTEESN
jgi:sensor c-di-GMP phosphodiesterase-like protein